jgi:D-sedoheptulose 7-phosphate isomerase
MKFDSCGCVAWMSDYLDKQREVLRLVSRHEIKCMIEMVQDALKHGRKIFVIGNGGSACNASHFAQDLGKGASDGLGDLFNFKPISLTDNVSWITAVANDYDYEYVFSNQLDKLASAGDVLIGISVSGTSPNLMTAFQLANSMGLRTIALTGQQAVHKESIGKISDLCITIPSEHYGIVEDAQMTILHLTCYYFMENPEKVIQGLQGD